MPQDIMIRDEASADAAAVRGVVEAAFGQSDEADLVDALRRSGDAVISLVAAQKNEIVGHIMFSRLVVPKRCLALAPLAVAPSRQGGGIGASLVRDGLTRAGRDGWKAVFVVGAPEYYRRFGFRTGLAEKFTTPYPKSHTMALELAPDTLKGLAAEVVYPPPFAELD